MKSKILTFLVLPLFVTGCATKKSEVATTLGYERSSKVTAGPYQLHYAKEGSEELMLVAKGNYNLVSKDGDGTDVYLDGSPFIHFDRRPDGSLTNLSMNILAKDGKAAVTMVDTNVDGEWDFKIDHVLGKVFVREGNQWVVRYTAKSKTTR
jgi:hypothetical protein